MRAVHERARHQRRARSWASTGNVHERTRPIPPRTRTSAGVSPIFFIRHGGEIAYLGPVRRGLRRRESGPRKRTKHVGGGEPDTTTRPVNPRKGWPGTVRLPEPHRLCLPMAIIGRASRSQRPNGAGVQSEAQCGVRRGTGGDCRSPVGRATASDGCPSTRCLVKSNCIFDEGVERPAGPMGTVPRSGSPGTRPPRVGAGGGGREDIEQ